MSDGIDVCCHADFRLLSVWMGYVKRYIDPNKTENRELDKDVDSGMMAGLNDDDKLQ